MTHSQTCDFPSRRNIIVRSGGPAALGRLIGVDQNTTKAWKRNDSIPSAYWHGLASAEIATLEELAACAARGAAQDWHLSQNEIATIGTAGIAAGIAHHDMCDGAENWRTHDSTSAIDDEHRVVLCAVCEARLDNGWRACSFADCPHSSAVTDKRLAA